MRKFAKISAALAAMVLVLSFAGCSDGGSSNGDEIVGGSSSGSGSGSGSSSDGSSSSGSGSSSSGDSSGSGSSSSGGSSESENISLKGTYWTRVKDKGTYWQYGGEYYYFTSDTVATCYKYDDANSRYKVDGEMTFSVSGNVLTAITYAGYKLGEGDFTGYSASLTFSDSTMAEVLTSPDKTESKNFKKVDSKPTGKTREDKSSTESGSSSSGDSSGSSSGSSSSGSGSAGTGESSSSGSGSGSSSSSESDDDWKKILPASQGENPLSGNSYSYAKIKGLKTTTYSFVFTEDTAVESEVKSESGKSESSVREYKYTYNADKGLLYLKLVSWTVDGEKITSSEEFFEFCAKYFEMTVEEAKELMADYNDFEGYQTRNCFKKDASTVVFGDYFDGKIVGPEFNYYISGNSRIQLNNGITVENKATGKKYEYEDGDFASDKKTFIFSNANNVRVSGSWSTVVNASKTLKEQYEETNSYSDKKTEKNGYIIVKFSELSSEMQVSPFNMVTNSSYKFFFDPNAKDFTKMN